MSTFDISTIRRKWKMKIVWKDTAVARADFKYRDY